MFWTPAERSHLLAKDQPDLVELKRFAQSEDAGDTPFYVGREAIAEEIFNAAEVAMEGFLKRPGKGAARRTRVVQGAPGAGKSAFLQELHEECQRRQENAAGGFTQFPELRKDPKAAFGIPPVAILARNTDLKSERTIVCKIAEGLFRGSSDAFRNTKSGRLKAGARIGLGEFFSLFLAAGEETVTGPPEARFENLKELPLECLGRPVLLLVDEVQDVTLDCLPVLSALHEGTHGFPIIPVYGGLANSCDALQSMEGSGRGLTRLNPENIHRISALPKTEAKAAVMRMLRECQVKNAEETRIPEMLAEASSCWPQHLHNGMRMLAEELIDPAVQGDLREVGLSNMIAKESELRQQDHSLRRTMDMKVRPVLVARILRSVPDGKMKAAEVVRVIGELSKRGEDITCRLPEGMAAETFLFDHMVRKGALDERKDGMFASPIPCFRSYLIAEGGALGGKVPLLECLGQTQAVPRKPEIRT